MPVVDINIHHLPEDLFDNEAILNGFLDSAPRGFGEIASVITMDNGKKQLVLEKPKGYPNLNYVEGDYSAEAKLKAMDEAGVDYGIMRVPVWQEWLGLDTCRRVNDNAAEIVKRADGRLFSTACVPPWGGKENIYELERCIGDLGVVGVQLACHYGQLYLDDEVFEPYLKVLNDKNIPVIVHHTPLPVEWRSVIDYQNLRREFGRIVDQATAVGRELFSGMFDKFPNLRFIHTMLGGNWFANASCSPRTPRTGTRRWCAWRPPAASRSSTTSRTTSTSTSPTRTRGARRRSRRRSRSVGPTTTCSGRRSRSSTRGWARVWTS